MTHENAFIVDAASRRVWLLLQKRGETPRLLWLSIFGTALFAETSRLSSVVLRIEGERHRSSGE